MIKHINIDVGRFHVHIMWVFDYWYDKLILKDLYRYIEQHPEISMGCSTTFIPLIKAYRKLYPEAGLREAKAAVEYMLEKERL